MFVAYQDLYAGQIQMEPGAGGESTVGPALLWD